MLVSENVGLAHEGRGDASAVDATAAALRLGLFDCRGDASCVVAEAPAGDERGIRASQARWWQQADTLARLYCDAGRRLGR